MYTTGQRDIFIFVDACLCTHNSIRYTRLTLGKIKFWYGSIYLAVTRDTLGSCPRNEKTTFVTLVRNANACEPIRAMSGFLATYKLDLLTPPNKKTTYSRRELFKYAWAPFFTDGLAIPGVYLITDISFQRHRKQSVGEFFHIENEIYGCSWSKAREPAKKWTPWITTNWTHLHPYLNLI